MSAKDYRLRLNLPGHGSVYLFTIAPLTRDPDLAAAVIAATDGTPFHVEVQLADGWHEIDPKEH